MNVQLVADVGNSRVKWGLCAGGKVAASASLPHDDPAAWEKQLAGWRLTGSLMWAVGGVHPARLEGLTRWLEGRGDVIVLLTRHDRLPLAVRVDAPERVGVDRLLNAVAANDRLRRGAKGRAPRAAVVIDAGTAVTVDWVGPDGAFEGGAIFPGLRLMAAALHDYTALLPLVDATAADPPPVGKNTAAAIEAGIHHAVAGGVNQLIRRQRAARPAIFLTGGDAALLRGSIDGRPILWPEMTLEGLRISAGALP